MAGKRRVEELIPNNIEYKSKAFWSARSRELEDLLHPLIEPTSLPSIAALESFGSDSGIGILDCFIVRETDIHQRDNLIHIHSKWGYLNHSFATEKVLR